MNEDKMLAPKDSKPGEYILQRVSSEHSCIYLGDEWVATAKPEVAKRLFEILEQEKAQRI